MAETYRVGTRTSPLALRQVEEVLQALRRFYPDFKAEIAGIDTYGDRDKLTPIVDIEGTDFFTREIDAALLKGAIDFAVHSAKDLPDSLKKGLVIAALTESIAPGDALAAKSGWTLNTLPRGARIGTSSARRKAQLRAYREDLEIVDIRGNIGERLGKLANGNLEGIVIAACALLRLGLEDKITQRIPREILKPHPLQGALAVVVRAEDAGLRSLLAVVDTREVPGQ